MRKESDAQSIHVDQTILNSLCQVNIQFKKVIMDIKCEQIDAVLLADKVDTMLKPFLDGNQKNGSGNDFLSFRA